MKRLTVQFIAIVVESCVVVRIADHIAVKTELAMAVTDVVNRDIRIIGNKQRIEDA